MAFIKFADDAAMYGATAIDNMFIIEYLPAAPDAFLKVYLYARMLCMHPQMGGMEEMQRALNMDDEAIMTAFAYWERAGLVQRIADNPPEYCFLSPRMGVSNDYDRDYYKYRDFNGALQKLFPGDKQLLHPAQYALANDWVENLHLTQDAVVALLQHYIENSRSSSPDPVVVFRKADKKALQLSDAGITDAEGVMKELSSDGVAMKMAREVIKQLGMRRNPTRPEQEMAARWMKDLGATMDDILSACAETVKAQNPSFGYLDTILKNRLAADADTESMRRALASLGMRPVVGENHMDWYSRMKKDGFDAGTIEFAAAYQANRIDRSLSGVEKLLGKWKDRGIFTRKAAEDYVAYNRALYDELKAMLKLARNLSEQEVAAYDAWKQALPMDMLVHAAENSASKNEPVRAMAGMVNHWLESGITSLDAARSEKTTHAEKANPALDYEQRDYSNMDFEDDSFMDEARRYLESQGKN